MTKPNYLASNEMIPVDLDAVVIRQLRPFAAARDVTVPRLIGDLLETTIRDELVSAILDDGDKGGGGK